MTKNQFVDLLYFHRRLKRWLFPLFLVVAFGAFVLARYIEDQPYSGDVSVVAGTVNIVRYVSGGTLTGRSYYVLQLNEGNRLYRMPVGVEIWVNVGDRVRLVVAADDIAELKDEVRVVDYTILK